MKFSLMSLLLMVVVVTLTSIFTWKGSYLIFSLISLSVVSMVIVSLMLWKYMSESVGCKILLLGVETANSTLLLMGYFFDISPFIWVFVVSKFYSPIIVYFILPYMFIVEEDSWYQVSLLGYIGANKAWGVMVFSLLPVDNTTLLLICCPMLIALIVFYKGNIKDFYMSIIVLEGVTNMLMLAGGVDYFYMGPYIVCSFLMHVLGFKVVNEQVNLVSFYCFLVSAGVPAFPGIIIKYAGLMGVYQINIFSFVGFMVVYGFYMGSAMIFVSHLYLKNNSMAIYVVVCILMTAITCLTMVAVWEWHCKMIGAVKFLYKVNKVGSGEVDVEEVNDHLKEVNPMSMELEELFIKDCLSEFKVYSPDFPEDGVTFSTMSKSLMHLKVWSFSFTYLFPKDCNGMSPESPLMHAISPLSLDNVMYGATPKALKAAEMSGSVHWKNYKPSSLGEKGVFFDIEEEASNAEKTGK